MPKRNLLLCFDAFGTLFKPKLPVLKQYGEVARRLGLGGFSDDQLQSSFRTAFKSQASEYPNYGRSTGMGATKWWTNVIQKTFQPWLPPGQQLPEELAPKLLHRFSSDEGYSMDSQLLSWLRALKRPHPGGGYDGLIIGVVTNSDDRVPGILSSFGLSVSPLRYGLPTERRSTDGGHDIDFHCMSYDVGFEKPDRRIFDAADELARKIIASGGSEETTASEDGPATWTKIYVGDEYEKDVVGALGAGWNAVLIDAEEQHPQIPRLGGSPGNTEAADTIFTPGTARRIRDIGELVEYLIGRT